MIGMLFLFFATSAFSAPCEAKDKELVKFFESYAAAYQAGSAAKLEKLITADFWEEMKEAVPAPSSKKIEVKVERAEEKDDACFVQWRSSPKELPTWFRLDSEHGAWKLAGITGDDPV